MLARDVMSHPAMTVHTSTSCTAAAQLLVENGFTAAPVIDDDDRLVGIITEADLMRGRVPPDPRRRDPYQTARYGRRPPSTVAAAMTTPVESVTPGADIADAARIMLDEHLRCLPIVDGLTVVGVITRRDLLRAIITHDDKALTADIVNRLAALDRPDRWNVSVQAGVADITDHVDDAEDRTAAERIASSTPGVVHATAHYETSDPF